MDKRIRIINAAIKLFKEKGIESTKISDITREARIASGTFYLYFPSKLSVMPAITDVMIQEMINAIKENVTSEGSFDDKLFQLIDTVFNVTKDNKQLVKIIYNGLAASEYLDDWVDAYLPYYNWLSDLVNKANEAGEIALVIDSRQMAKILYGVIESAAERAYLFDEKNEKLILQDKQDVFSFINKVLAR